MPAQRPEIGATAAGCMTTSPVATALHGGDEAGLLQIGGHTPGPSSQSFTSPLGSNDLKNYDMLGPPSKLVGRRRENRVTLSIAPRRTGLNKNDVRSTSSLSAEGSRNWRYFPTTLLLHLAPQTGFAVPSDHGQAATMNTQSRCHELLDSAGHPTELVTRTTHVE